MPDKGVEFLDAVSGGTISVKKPCFGIRSAESRSKRESRSHAQSDWLSGLAVSLGSAFLVYTRTRGAWVGNWLIAVILALVFSIAAWLAARVTSPSFIDESAGVFVLKSVFAVGLVAVVFFRYLVIRARCAR